MRFGLAHIDGLLTSVGGYNKRHTNILLSLTGEGERRQWSEVFHPMLIARSYTACITTEQALIVAGGLCRGDPVDTVEVMNISTKVWTTASSLPQKLSLLSGIVSGDTLYLAGGFTGRLGSNKVFACSLPDLLKLETVGSSRRRTFSLSSRPIKKPNVWKEIGHLPVTYSTLATVGGHLLSVGGQYDSLYSTTHVYSYDSQNDSWCIISEMKNKRSQCFSITLPEDQLIVVGGWTDRASITSDSVEEVELL